MNRRKLPFPQSLPPHRPPPPPPAGRQKTGGNPPATAANLARFRIRAQRRFYDELVQRMKNAHNIAIRKWRMSMTGVAYELRYSNGRMKRMVSAPRPRSPVSACIFLHEVGHHAIGFRKFRPRCLEEYHVWQWAFAQMRRYGIPINPRVLRHYRRSMYHYVRLARRRGLRQLPPILGEFQSWPE